MVQLRTHIRPETNKYSVDIYNLEQGHKAGLSLHAESELWTICFSSFCLFYVCLSVTLKFF